MRNNNSKQKKELNVNITHAFYHLHRVTWCYDSYVHRSWLFWCAPDLERKSRTNWGSRILVESQCYRSLSLVYIQVIVTGVHSLDWIVPRGLVTVKASELFQGGRNLVSAGRRGHRHRRCFHCSHPRSRQTVVVHVTGSSGTHTDRCAIHGRRPAWHVTLKL